MNSTDLKMTLSRTAWCSAYRLTSALGAVWLEAYGMDEVDVTIIDVVGTFRVGL